MNFLAYIANIIGPIIARGNYQTSQGRKLFEVARSCLGKDVAPLENEFGCAEAVNNIVFKAFGDYAGGDLSTFRMYHALRNNRKFVVVSSPLPGDIILSPTGMGNGRLKNGHTGIVGQNNMVMSNSSDDGLFKENFTLSLWRERYQRFGGFPVYFYRRIIT